jgi:ubiquitin C-terminal hydrolase
MTKSHDRKHNKKAYNSTSNGHGFKVRPGQKSHQQQPQPIKRDNHSIQPQKQQKMTILKPTDEIFDPAIVSKYMLWKTDYSKAGPGLNNHGNTCFLNSTLQCLLHTPALSQVLLNESQVALKGLDSRNNSTQRSILQHYQSLVVDIWTPTGKRRTISPRSMVQNIKRVGKQFRPNRQEDAHEYLRYIHIKIFVYTYSYVYIKMHIDMK